VEQRRVRVNKVEFEDEENRRQVRIELDVPLGAAEARLVDELASLEEVTAVRWTE
jgi:hypothetical protein